MAMAQETRADLSYSESRWCCPCPNPETLEPSATAPI